MDMWQLMIVTLVLFTAELFYFRIANRYGIVDKPNDRSSHGSPTIRGGGVIFFAAILVWFMVHDFQWPWLVCGATVVAVISFMDDVKPRPALVRFSIHLIGVVMMFYQVPLFDWPVWLVTIALIVCIGSLSAFNFMDGINGITGVYALVSLASFGYIHTFRVAFTDLSLIVIVSTSVLIFLFFNFRNRARCFAGDIGSVTIAFVLIFFLLQLINTTHNFLWPLLFLVYGTDAIVTIIYRIRKGENIFKPHRTHLYQNLCNELRWSHQKVSIVYGGVQLLFNVIVINALLDHSYIFPLIVALVFIIGYLIIRVAVTEQIEKMKRV